MSSKSKRIQGIVVGRKDLFETDKLITLFTPNLGKIKLLAKGVRKTNSSRIGKLELGNQIKALIISGKSFSLITEVEIIKDSLSLRKNTNKINGLIIICELINKLLPEQEQNVSVWDDLIKILERLKQGNLNQIVEFEAKLIKNLGFGITKKEESYWRDKDWKKLHRLINNRLEQIAEKPFKSLSLFK